MLLAGVFLSWAAEGLQGMDKSGRTVPAWLSGASGVLGGVRSFPWEMPPGWRSPVKPGITLKMQKLSIYILLLLKVRLGLGWSQP